MVLWDGTRDTRAYDAYVESVYTESVINSTWSVMSECKCECECNEYEGTDA